MHPVVYPLSAIAFMVASYLINRKLGRVAKRHYDGAHEHLDRAQRMIFDHVEHVAKMRRALEVSRRWVGNAMFAHSEREERDAVLAQLDDALTPHHCDHRKED